MKLSFETMSLDQFIHIFLYLIFDIMCVRSTLIFLNQNHSKFGFLYYGPERVLVKMIKCSTLSAGKLTDMDQKK